MYYVYARSQDVTLLREPGMLIEGMLRFQECHKRGKMKVDSHTRYETDDARREGDRC